MTPSGGRFLRDNAFLVAAVALPVVVVAFFLLASLVPRWRVPPPAYDLILSANAPYRQTQPRIAVDFKVRDGRVEATVRPLAPNEYVQFPEFFVFDHKTMSLRQIPYDLPDSLSPNDSPRTIVIDGLAGRKVLAQTKAPDGYEFQSRNNAGPGILGELFGIGRHGRASLVNSGRVVPITLPSPYEDHSSMSAVGWLADEGQR